MRSYGTLVLSESSPIQTFSEPLTLAEVREFLALPVLAIVATETLSFPQIPDGGSAALTITLAGVSVGDSLTPTWPSTLESGLIGSMIVTAADTVEVRLFNLSGSDLTPAAQVFSVTSNTASSTSAMLEGFIISAREIAELLFGKQLIVKQYDMYFDYFHDEIELPEPLTSVDLVRRRDSDGAYTNLAEGTDYIVDLPRGLITTPYNVSWPSYTEWPSSSVLVRFTCGYAADHPFWSNAGQRILVGMKLLISAWYNNRLPFEIGNSQGMNEYAFTVSHLFGFGSIPRIG